MTNVYVITKEDGIFGVYASYNSALKVLEEEYENQKEELIEEYNFTEDSSVEYFMAFCCYNIEEFPLED